MFIHTSFLANCIKIMIVFIPTKHEMQLINFGDTSRDHDYKYHNNLPLQWLHWIMHLCLQIVVVRRPKGAIRMERI